MLITFSLCFFPILLTTARGLHEAEPELFDLVRSLRGSRWQLFRFIQLPGALPYVFSGMKVALLHAGCADPLRPIGEKVMELVRKFPNLYLSTSMPGEVWDDGTEYPFPNYLRRMETLIKGVGAHRVMWATDWPWFDWAYKYEQAANAIRRHARFLSETEKAAVLGETAVEFVGL